MAKKRRKGGRYTAPKHHEFSGRDKVLRLTGPKPNDVERQVLRQYVANGWLRYWPPDLLVILCVAAQNGAEPDHDAFVDEADSFDPDASVWSTPVDVDDADRQEEVRIHLERCSEAAGLPSVNTRRDLLALAEHFSLVRRDDGGRVVIVDPLPLVAETGQLSPEQVAREDRLRWRDQFEGLSQRVIRRFVEQKLDEWRAPLDQVAAAIDAPIEDTRHALAVLCDEGDFTVQPDPEGVADLDEVLIVVDWAAFDRTRFQLAGHAGEDEDRDA